MSSDQDQYLQECLSIVPESIQDEFVRVPTDIAYWNAQYADAMRAYLFAKIGVKKEKALAHARVRSALIKNVGKATVSDIEAGVNMDLAYLQAEELAADAEAEKERLKGICEAVRSRKDALISLGNLIREEMRGDPVLRDRMGDQNRGM